MSVQFNFKLDSCILHANFCFLLSLLWKMPDALAMHPPHTFTKPFQYQCRLQQQILTECPQHSISGIYTTGDHHDDDNDDVDNDRTNSCPHRCKWQWQRQRIQCNGPTTKCNTKPITKNTMAKWLHTHLTRANCKMQPKYPQTPTGLDIPRDNGLKLFLEKEDM